MKSTMIGKIFQANVSGGSYGIRFNTENICQNIFDDLKKEEIGQKMQPLGTTEVAVSEPAASEEYIALQESPLFFFAPSSYCLQTREVDL